MASRSLPKNNEYRSFIVALIGAEACDEMSLKRLLSITRYRTRRYQLTAISTQCEWEEARQRISSSDIVVINTNNAEGMIFWKRLSSDLPPEFQRPVIQITRQKSPQSDPNLTISWPINPSRVIQTLDRYTIDHLNFIPEFEIGEDNASPANEASLSHIRSAGDGLPGVKKSDSDRTSAPKALVADDSLAVRRQLAMEFERMGCELKMVADGDAALEAAQQDRYDIIFLDVIMPGMDGYSVCKAIRRTDKNRGTPVVLLTSKSSRFDKLKGHMSGCDTYLTKPVNHNDFCSIAERHLKAGSPA